MSGHVPPGGGFFGWVSRHPRPAFWATLAAALLVGIAVGAVASLVGAPGDREATERRLAQTRDALEASEGGQRSTGKRGASAPKPRPKASSSPDGVRTFSGNGGKNLGTIKVSRESVLEWTSEGALFQIFSSSIEAPAPVNSQGGSGDTVLSEGDYDEFKVNALGNWTIKIRPR